MFAFTRTYSCALENLSLETHLPSNLFDVCRCFFSDSETRLATGWDIDWDRQVPSSFPLSPDDLSFSSSNAYLLCGFTVFSSKIVSY